MGIEERLQTIDKQKTFDNKEIEIKDFKNINEKRKINKGV